MASKKDSNISRFSGNEPEKKKENNRKGLYIGSVVVLVLITISFIGAPLIGGFGGQTGGGRLVFGYYRDTPIEYKQGNYFSRQLQAMERQASEEGMQQQDPQMQVYQVWRGAFDRALLRSAILYQADASGIPVSSDQVDRAIAQNPQFRENNRFEPSLYQRLGSQQQFQLRQLTADNLRHERYLNDMLELPRTSAAAAVFFAEMASPERSIEYVSLRFNQYPEAEIQEFISERPELFQSIEASTITLPTAEYSRSRAENIREEIASSDTFFEDAARNYSSDMFADNGGDAGELFYYDLLPDYPSADSVDSVFGLDQGEISPVLESNRNYVIYRINRAAVSPDPADQDIQNQARNYLQDFERGRIADYYAALAEDFTAAARNNGLQAAAGEFDFTVHDTDYFALNYGSLPYYSAPPRNTELGSVGRSRSFYKAVFGTPVNAVSEPVALQDRIIVLVPADQREIDDQLKDSLSGFYPNFTRQATAQHLERLLLDEEHITDNFMEVMFSRILNLDGE